MEQLMDNKITKKDDIITEDMLMWQWKLFVVFGHFCAYANNHNLPVKITSLISDRANVRQQTRTHMEGRAADVSSIGWSEEHIEGVQDYMNKIANHYGAISARDYERRVIVYHNYQNQGDHFHIQVER